MQENPMKSSMRILATLLLTGLIPTAQAKRAPNLEFKDLAGHTEKTASLRGSIVVLNFWATWCGPCQEELPLLSKLTQEYAPKKVHFVSASADVAKDHAKVEQYVALKKPAMDIWLGADLDMLDRLNLGNLLPATIILDEQGEVIARIEGQAREEDLRAPLDWLLNGKSGPAPTPVTKRY
jgi:thiol-disulfide isomerase/thioredoxin